ncbi:MAG: hypothetical protein AB1942_08420 [Pseudomonadota bacterium]
MTQAGGERPYAGWLLAEADRARLLVRFAPRYETVVAHHVTHAYDPPLLELPPEVSAEIAGLADDGAGVQVLVVRVDGRHERADGSTYHVTWSLGPERRAWESNGVLREQGWTVVEPPVPVRLEPMVFRAPGSSASE